MKKKVLNTFAWIHRWVGFAIALLFLITLISGIYTGVARLADRYTGDYGQVYSPMELSQHGQALARMTAQYPDATSFVMPTADRPFYQAASRRQAAYLAQEDLRELEVVNTAAGPIERYVFMLHRNFARGRADRWMVAWLSLGAVVVALAGLVATVPYMRRIRRKDFAPKGLARRYMFRAHFVFGLIALPVILIMGLTGAALTYSALTREILNAEPRHITDPFDDPSYEPDPGWEGALKHAQAIFPKGELVRVTKPRGMPKGVLGQGFELRFRTAGDWHPSGASYVLMDGATWGLVAINRFSDKSMGQKISEMIRSVHEGRSMPNWYVVLLLMLNALTALVVLMGLLSFFERPHSLPKPTSIRRRARP